VSVNLALRALCAAALLCGAHAAQATLPDFNSVRAAHQPSDVTLLDRHGQPLQTLRVDHQVRRGAWLPLAEMSPALREALVASEDKRFWSHSGVDWAALAGSAWANAWNTRTRGASTVTMQLAGLIEPTLARPSGGRSVLQKVSQIALARELESRWRKTQILEAYLNQVPLRGELVGVPAAAQALFGKHASGLDTHEAAMLAALVRAPNASETEVTRRACEVLQSQGRPCTGLATLVAQSLARRVSAVGAGAENLAPHFARYWLAAGGGVRSTLDAGLQRLALAALRQQLAELRGREVDEGAVLVLDNRSGEVLAWVGGSGVSEVDAVLARRQPGSALKPFVYAEALQRRLITPQSWLLDEPLQLSAGRDAYQPQNFDHSWRGWVSASQALGSSLNVPAVRVGAMLGPDVLFEAMNRAGLRLRESAGFHGHALALGSAEVTLIDLANAYRMLANAGQWRPVASPSRSPTQPPRRVWDAAVAQDITTILGDTAARASSFGFDSPLATRRRVAVKTGTSKDMRDNWCVGYTDALTVAVWIGNASGAPMHGVSGVVGAAPVWRRIVQGLAPSAALPAVAVTRASPARAGTAAFGIGPLRDGSLLALDPDIPLARQRVRLQGPIGRWAVNGRWLNAAAAPTGVLWWSPTPGRHQLEVRDGHEQLLDRIVVDVRLGMPARAAKLPAANPKSG
jgi:penicillin-binding protein 1C